MEDTLFQSSALTVREQIRLPSETFFIPDSYKDAGSRQDVIQNIAGAESIAIADADMDGLTAAAVHYEVFPENFAFVSAGPHGGIPVDTALELVAKYASDGAVVTIADIGLDSADDASNLPKVMENAADVYWCDHHPWNSDEAKEFVRENTTRFVHNDDEDENDDTGALVEANAKCGAQITAEVLREEYDYEFHQAILNGIEAVAAYDLWRKDEDGDFIYDATEQLNSFAESVASSAGNPYSEGSFLDYIHRFANDGIDLISEPMVQTEIVQRHAAEEDKLVQVMDELEELSTSGTVTLDGDEVQVIIVYGRFDTNELSEQLQRTRGYDLVITLTPTGGVSFRSSEGFKDCTHIAYNFNGGGHPQASGGYIGDQFESILDYTEYWSTAGEAQRENMLEFLESMTPEQFTDDYYN